MLLRKIEDNILSTSNEAVAIGNSNTLFFVFILLFVLPVLPDSIYPIFLTIVFSILFIGLGFVLKGHRKIVFMLAFLAVITEWIARWADLKVISIMSLASTIILFNYVVVRLILQIVKSKEVDAGVIVGAINGYLLTGMAFSLVIGLIHIIDPASFGFEESNLNFADYSYFGLVTFSTLGYGDISPIKPLAKSVCTLTTVSGQIYLAVIIALLVGKFASNNQRSDIGSDDSNSD